MKKSLYLAFFLSVVAGLSALLITAMFDYASPILAERQQKLIDDSLSTMYRDVEYSESVFNEYTFDEESTVEELYEVHSASEVIGYVYQTSKLGRNADITMLIAVDIETSSVLDVVYLAQAETKGIGDRILSESYVDSILGQTADNVEVDLIAGATYSSRAVKEMVEEAMAHYATNRVGDGNE
jgi:Na+-translocating ferredoxin:NAD+ oxidoreductase RnfG subunit